MDSVYNRSPQVLSRTKDCSFPLFGLACGLPSDHMSQIANLSCSRINPFCLEMCVCLFKVKSRGDSILFLLSAFLYLFEYL